MTSSNIEGFRQFEMATTISFVFLAEHGFRRASIRVDDEATLIRYESKTIYVSLAYGAPSYEPEMSLGRIGIDDGPDSYGLEAGDLIQLKGCENWQWRAGNSNTLAGLLGELARLLSVCGKPCLRGEHQVFEEMKKRRNEATKQWLESQRATTARDLAAAAWNMRDYNAVVNHYLSMAETLSEPEMKRLLYAQKMTQEDNL